MNCRPTRHALAGLPATSGSRPYRRVAIAVASLIAWAGSAVSVLAQSSTSQFSATIEPSAITESDTATFSLHYVNIDPPTQPSLPEIPGLTFQYAGPKTQTSLSLSPNGGRTTQFTKSFNYRVRAARPGTYEIPAITHQVAGQTLRSNPVRLTVGKTDPNQYRQYGFVQLNVPKDEIYVGEVLPIAVLLYYRAGDNVQYPQLNNEGFTFAKFPEPTGRRVVQGNAAYNLFPFQTTATAVKSGDLEIGPARCSLDLHFSQNSGSRDLFERFFDFNNVVRRPTTLSSETKKVTVLPLPTQNRPADFDSAIGNFQWDVNVGQTQVAVGDPITLTITIHGRGNFNAVQLGAFDALKDFQVYEPKAKFTPQDPLNYTGRKVFEQVIIPAHSEVDRIPELRFSYFDPESKRYQTLAHPPTPIVVQPAASGGAQPTILANPQGEGSSSQGTDNEPGVAHIKARLGDWLPIQRPLIQQGWFIGLQCLPVFAFLAAVGYRIRNEYLARNPRRIRQRDANAAIERTFKDLRSAADRADTEGFYAHLFRILQLRIAERLDLPASSITAEVIDDRFDASQFEPGVLEETKALFALCDQARYAPGQTSDVFHDVIRRLETVDGHVAQAPIDGTANGPAIGRQR